MKTSIENSLPPCSKVWIYQSTRRFTQGEAETIREKVKQFVAQWNSHKVGVAGDGELLFDRFIVLMADELQVGVGGCSIDSSVHFIKSLGNEYRTNFFDRWLIAYKKDDTVLACNREEFEKLIEAGEIADDTIVFNTLLNTKKDFDGKWEVPYSESWLKNLRSSHVSFSSIL
jgi:hypothetical protein